MMFEWLDGYWTAMRHVANAAPQANQGPGAVDWAAAAGSLLAATAAAAAAWLTWRIAREQRRLTLEREGADIYRDALDFFAVVSAKRLEAWISYHRMSQENGRHAETDEWKDLVKEAKDVSDAYAAIGEKVNFIEKLSE